MPFFILFPQKQTQKVNNSAAKPPVDSGMFHDDEKNKYWVNVALEEYRVLREEILSQFQNRNNVLTFGSASLGFFATAASQIDKNQTIALYLIASILIPVSSALIILFWGVHSAKIARIGCYLRKRENVINKRCLGYSPSSSSPDECPLYWENSLGRSPRNRDETILNTVVVLAFTTASLICARFSNYPEMQLPQLQYYLLQLISGTIIVFGLLAGIWLTNQIYRNSRGCIQGDTFTNKKRFLFIIFKMFYRK